MRALTILSLLLVAVVFDLALAHALGLPASCGSTRRPIRPCSRSTTRVTLGGLVGEVGGLTALAVLLYLTPYGTSRFWWIAAALLLLASVHGTYWLVTHPVNNFWVKDVAMSVPGSTFFRMLGGGSRSGDWTELRNIWEWSHVIRALLATASLACLAYAATLFENTTA